MTNSIDVLDAPSSQTRQFVIHWFSLELLAIVFFIILAELTLHLEFVQRLLPQPNPYYQPGVETKRRALEDTLQEEGGIDVLFIGSSVVRTNVQPLTFDRVIANRTGNDIVSFNGGFSALTPDPVRLYLEHFWLEHSSPRMIIQGIRYSELRSKTTSGTMERFQLGRFEPKWSADTKIAELQAAALENIQLLYYRGVLTELLRFFQLPINRPRGFSIDSRGYNATQLTLYEAKAQGLLKKEPGYSGELLESDFRTGVRALEKTIEICKKNDIEYVLVNMPEHSTRFLAQPDGRERYNFYLQILEKLALSEGVKFVDLTAGDPATYNDTYFSDYYHMSPFGAEQFTKALARSLIEDIEKLDE